MKKTNADTIKIAGLAAAMVMALLFAGCAAAPGQDWHSRLAAELPVLGHRNWILIADSAYPAQSRAGIETIATGANQLQVVKAVLEAIDDAPHVQANVFLDAELAHVSQNDAPGIDAYRSRLAAVLNKHKLHAAGVPHEELIAKLDQAAKTFRILVLKTNLTLPYTSVFLQLDCGYWNAQAETRLRQTIEK